VCFRTSLESLRGKELRKVDVIPAVDIMDGKVVRLLRGDPRRSTSYEHLGDPLSLARRWVAEGARTIHIVDLDAALGLGGNLHVVEAIISSVRTRTQVGGGIRDIEKARLLLNMGAARVVLGSLAFKEPSAVETLVDEFGGNHAVVALDNLEGTVVIHGWKTSSGISVTAAAEQYSEMGVKLFLVTSVARDGTLSGPDLGVLASLCRQGYSVIAAGGIGSLEDLVALNRLGVVGVIVGKALYEGVFSLGEALRTVSDV
jgi:phosphoribosylformimino-5-aminoimidazole carboxamide ribotide isomerase